MFKQPCFIKRNTPELINKLKELGYKYEPQYDDTCDALHTRIGEYFGNAHFVDEHYEELNPNSSFDGIDCGTNEELFLAIAALRDDTDKYQWFKSDKGEFWKCNENIFHHRYINSEDLKLDVSVAITKADKPCADPIVPQDDTNCWHKATVEELVEYFKKLI